MAPVLERMELGTIVLLLLLAGGMWGFVELTEEVLEGETQALDRALLLMLRSSENMADPLGPAWLEEVGRDVTALGGVAVLTLLTLAVAMFMALRRLKDAFERTRPDLVPHGSYVASASFPSGHSMMAAVVYLTLGALLARVEPDGRVKVFVLGMAILLTLLVGLSRVYLGVHWPTDILAGWTLGAAWALLFWLIARALQRRGRVEIDQSQ
jgi:undecaprenyl-diphosphatase